MNVLAWALLVAPPFFTAINALPGPPPPAPVPTPAGLSVDGMKDAFPPRDPANVLNWYGTSLYGWDKCDEKDTTWKEKIQEAYTDANKLVNYAGVRSNLDFNSAAALEYLGPSGE
jgi:hypothetical protein